MNRLLSMAAGSLLAISSQAGWASECLQRADTLPLPPPAVRRGHEIRFEPLIDRISAQLAAGGRVDVLMLGDSITQRWPRPMLTTALGTESMVNAGIPGDDTSALFWRLSESREPARVAGKDKSIGIGGWSRIQPRNIVLLIGTNDLPRQASGCDVFARIRRIVGKVHDLYPGVPLTVMSVLPRGERMSQFSSEIAEINSTLARSAEGLKFKFLDAHDAFLCGRQTNCPLMVSGTNVHPSREGYEVLGKLLATHLAGKS